MRLYSKRQPEAIEWVFRTHRERSEFWPAIKELNSLFGEYYRMQGEQETCQYLESLREVRERLKLEGLPYGEAQVAALRKQLLTVAKAMEPICGKSANEQKKLLAVRQQSNSQPRSTGKG